MRKREDIVSVQEEVRIEEIEQMSILSFATWNGDNETINFGSASTRNNMKEISFASTPKPGMCSTQAEERK